VIVHLLLVSPALFSVPSRVSFILLSLNVFLVFPLFLYLTLMAISDVGSFSSSCDRVKLGLCFEDACYRCPSLFTHLGRLLRYPDRRLFERLIVESRLRTAGISTAANAFCEVELVGESVCQTCHYLNIGSLSFAIYFTPQ